jgi:hypothetical protein
MAGLSTTEQKQLIWTVPKQDLFRAVLYWICSMCGQENHPLYTRCQNCKHIKLGLSIINEEN